MNSRRSNTPRKCRPRCHASVQPPVLSGTVPPESDVFASAMVWRARHRGMIVTASSGVGFNLIMKRRQGVVRDRRSEAGHRRPPAVVSRRRRTALMTSRLETKNSPGRQFGALPRTSVAFFRGITFANTRQSAPGWFVRWFHNSRLGVTGRATGRGGTKPLYGVRPAPTQGRQAADHEPSLTRRAGDPRPERIETRAFASAFGIAKPTGFKRSASR